MTTITRESKGRPVGGQFSAHTRADGGIALQNTITIERETNVNDAYPFPQANKIETIGCVVDAVAAGANTGESVAETLNLAGREGSYYADAAGYLGFIDTVSGADVKTYELTALGEELLAADPAERVEILRSATADVPAVQIYGLRGEAGVRELLDEVTTLGESTSARRAATIASWYTALASSSELASAIEAEHAGASDRAFEAAMNAERARQDRLARAVATEHVLAVCPICFMGLPLTGLCENC